MYEGGGIWRLKPEVTQEPEEAYQEQINVADEYIPAPETEDAQALPQAEFEVYGQQEQEEYGADEQQALAQEDPEVNEQQHSFRVFGIQDETEDQETGTETEEPAPNYIEFSVPEVEEQMDMTINEEEQMITFNVIGDENEEGAELTEEDEEYYDYYDYGYYDDWYSYDSVSAEQINTATPYLLVKSYSHKKTIKTGEAFGIDVTFLNTSGKLGMENIVIKVETSDALSLENGTNVLFVNDLAAGQS